MNIKWRLSIMIFQLTILIIATEVITGQPLTTETWFAAGLFAVVITPQLQEPYFSRPADVIANSAIVLVLFLTTKKTVSNPGWVFLAILLVISLLFSIIALIFGTSKTSEYSSIAHTARAISKEATALRIYSIVFLLSLVEAYPSMDQSFWTLLIAWGVMIILGSINWQYAFSNLVGSSIRGTVEGMVGPSTLSISASVIPNPGSKVIITAGGIETEGAVIERINRIDDVWGQIHIADQQVCESLTRSQKIQIELIQSPQIDILGTVDVGSSDKSLVFTPTTSLEIGNVVSVQSDENEIYYQLNSAKVQQADVKGGSHLQVWGFANQLGTFEIENLRFRRHRWVPDPGAVVIKSSTEPQVDPSSIPSTWINLGNVLGTRIPLFMDIDVALEGHVAVLGMTKMGKTSLACRIANHLANSTVVTILDQTGEYIGKRGYPRYSEDFDNSDSGFSVMEPPPRGTPAEGASTYLSRIVGLARREYSDNTSKSRVILIDEAHQYIPEPSGLSFNAPERGASIKFSNLMMQIRKYGITIMLISQRTAVVAKSALSQCENIIVFKSVDQTGLGYLEAVVGNEVREILPRLQQGEALVFGPAFSSDAPVVINVSYEGSDTSTKEQA